MRHVLVIYVLILVLSLTQAEKKVKVQEPEVTKLEVVNLGEAEIGPDLKQSDVQRKRDSGFSYSRPNRVSSSGRFRFQVHQSKGQIASKVPSLLIRPFTKYGPPSHSTSGPITHGHAEQQRSKLHHVNQQQSIRFDYGLVDQEVPSPIRNVDFAEASSIASQNNEPFGMHTANYLPPQNQKLPAYSSTNNFTPQSHPPSSSAAQVQSSQSQNFISQPQNQISDAALFLSENAQAIQQLYGAPASSQNFAPGNEQFHGAAGNQIQRPNDQFGNFESTSQSPQEFGGGALPPYASGTLNPHETLQQIQSLEKDRLIVQLQQALAQARTTPSAEAAARYAQNQASFIQNQELLASISQQVKQHVTTPPQSAVFATGSTAFSQSPFLPGSTTINPSELPLNYGVPTTVQTPTTTVTGAPVVQTPPSSKGDGTAQVTLPQPAPNRPGSPAISSAVGIPVYGGFVPTLITGSNLLPSYSTSILSPGPVRPGQSAGASPTHFGIPIPTEPPAKPGSAIPATTIPSVAFKPDQAGVAFAPAFTPVALPVQPLRPISAPLHPLATPVHPVAPGSVTSSVQHTYDVQTALINPGVLYKPVKAVLPVYYYPNVAYQKPALAVAGWPSYPWSYAPTYAQTKPAQIWK
ncbi:uncharacterized protein [Linepithema humile]|uniref:uncharacterized protein n=1 Tax=Linepithema humile TaxID=83485 RepID=UPI00351E534D